MMSRLHTLSMLTLVCLMFTCASAYAQKDVKEEIMQANERFMSLFAAGDAAAFVEGMYTEDAILYPPNSPAVFGKDAMEALWGGMMEAGVEPKVKTKSALAHGKTAIEEGTVDIFAGGQKVDEVKYMVIWKKVKGEWMMHRDMWNGIKPAGNH